MSLRKNLLENSPQPVGELMALIAYGMAKYPDKIPEILWGFNRISFSFRGERFDIAKFRLMIKNLVSKTRDLVNKLTFREYWTYEDPVAGKLIDVRDNHRETLAGYSFMNDSRNSWINGLEKLASTAILHSEDLFNRFLIEDQGGYRWRDHGINDYLEDCEKLLEYLAILIHTTSGMPGRGPEILDLNIHNTMNQHRHIHIDEGRVMIATT